MAGTEANPAGIPSRHPGAGGVGAAPSAKGTPTAGGIRVGAWVQVVGRRGRFRVVGVTAHGVELRDRDERWHVVRHEKMRPAGHDLAQAGRRATRQPPSQVPGPDIGRSGLRHHGQLTKPSRSLPLRLPRCTV